MTVTIEKVNELLKSDFEKQLFKASLKNLNDSSNELRYHNFCYSIRELSRHFLHSLSKDALVKNCSWFKEETDNGMPTRAQRIKFAIQGGMLDETLEIMGLDLEFQKETIKEVITIINSLSKYTHINPESFILTDVEIESNSQKVLETFELLVETINNHKEDLKQFLDSIIHDNMIDAIISNSYENIDMLAPHFSLDFGEVEDHYVEEITDKEIVVNVSGNLYVTLEYGSRNERRNDDGLDIDESFPFNTKIRYLIEEGFSADLYEVDPFDVDTSSWYGDDEFNDDEIENLIK